MGTPALLTVKPIFLSGILWTMIMNTAAANHPSRTSNNHRTANDTLALIGDRAITVNQFKALFKERLISTGLTDNGNARSGYLTNLVDDELLIKQAKCRKLDRTAEAVKKKTLIKNQELLLAYSKKHLAGRSEVTENDLRDLFVRMNKKIKVSHIYAKTKSLADSLYREIALGAGFDDIAKKTFTDPVLKEHGGLIGYISLDEMDPEFERVAYQMQVGEISKPVKTVQGYSIIRVEDIKGNPFVTESEYLKAREKIKGFAKRRKYEETAREFTSGLRSQLHIKCNTELMTKYFDISSNSSRRLNTESAPLVMSSQELQKTVVAWTLGKWSLRELISVMEQTSEQQRTWIHTEDNLEDFAAGLILQKYILQEAAKEKLNTTASYRQSVHEAFETYLLSVVENQLKNTMKPSRDSLESYYASHKKDFLLPEETRLSAILVGNTATRDSIKQKLDHGSPFSDLARQYSIQTVTAERGGDLGFYRRDELGDLGSRLFSLQPGDWTGPIPDQEKYLFIQCTERKSSVQRSFEESKKDIEEVLVSMAWINSRRRYADSLKIQFGCRIFPEKLQTITLD